MYKNVDLSNILYQFNIVNYNYQKIKEKNTKKPRTVYKINTYDNFFCLKKSYLNINNLLFIYSYLEWLNLNNFKVPYFIKNLYGEPYVNYNKDIYLLCNWMEGENIDYNNLNHCILSVIYLSKIHNISNNILFIKNSEIKNNFENINKKFKKHEKELFKFYKVAQCCDDHFSKNLINNFEKIIYLSNIAIKYSSYINYGNLNKSLCHGDYVSKNILLNDNQIVPIDFDKSSINYSISDFSYFLRRYLRRDLTNWNFDNTLKLINYYKKYNNISLDEYYYLLSYLSFPQKIWKFSKLYYTNYNNLSDTEKIYFTKSLFKTIQMIDNHIFFTIDFRNYINIYFKK